MTDDNPQPQYFTWNWRDRTVTWHYEDGKTVTMLPWEAVRRALAVEPEQPDEGPDA